MTSKNDMEISNSLIDIIRYEKGYDNLNEERFKVKLWTFLGKRIERYTMGDSTSVPIEVAEELLKSICFSFELLSKNIIENDGIIYGKDLEKLLEDAWKIIECKIEKGKYLLKKVKYTSPDVENISYKDTLIEIEEFFKRYDFRFFAHNIECSIDYQLSNPVDESLQGIQYINQYLENLLIENEICSNFHKDKIINLLNSYCSDYKGLLINIFEPILTNVIGLVLIDEDVFKLDISRFQREVILNKLKDKSKEQLMDILKNLANKVCYILKINDEAERGYVETVSLALRSRIETALEVENFENIFLSFKYSEIEDEFVFKDNENMDNNKLCALIDEINDCRYLGDKIKIVKNEVSSLGDIIEVLNLCFWEEEVIELLKHYSRDEIYAINYYLDYKGEYFSSNTRWEVKFREWVKEKK